MSFRVHVNGRNATEGVPYRNVFVHLLVEFLFRLTFGVATAMALTSSRWVTSGFFRVHLWVLLGVQTLAALATSNLLALDPIDQARGSIVSTVYRGRFWLAVAAAIASYLGAVVWMYERRLAGKAAIVAVSLLSLAGVCLPVAALETSPRLILLADRVTSGLLLGLVTTAMLLGHWYLNTPTMKLEPLKRLIVLLGAAVILRAIVCFPGAWLVGTAYLPTLGMPASSWFLFVALRWLSGLGGVLVLAILTWQTLKIPNTQSATGILYAGVVLAFIGELTSQILSSQAQYPV